MVVLARHSFDEFIDEPLLRRCSARHTIPLVSDLSPARFAGVVYVLYFALAIAGGVLARGDIAGLARGQAATPATAVWIASTAIYAVLVVLLARLVWDVDPRIALAAIVVGLVGCVIQSAASLVGLGRWVPIAALFCFGIFMVLYGWVITRSTAVPSPIGVMFIIAGLGWCAPVIPGFPAALGAIVQGFGAVAEIVLAVWLLIHG